MTAARIILWRHGRTDWNVIDRFQGQADIPLDDVGSAQALRAAEVLAAYRPSRLYSSDLSRCYQTAEMLAQRTGLDITTDKRLREFMSLMEGLRGRRSGLLIPNWRAGSGPARTYDARPPVRARPR